MTDRCIYIGANLLNITTALCACV